MPPPASPEPPNTFAGSVIIASGVISGLGLALLFGYILLGPMLIAVVVIGVVGTAFGLVHWWLWGRSMSDGES